MKYGREGLGHTAGSELRHDAGSWAVAVVANEIVAIAAPTNATNADKPFRRVSNMVLLHNAAHPSARVHAATSD